MQESSQGKIKLVFFGNERLATGLTTTVPVLRALIDAGYEIMCLVVSHGQVVSRSSRELEIIEVAKAHNIPVLAPENLKDIADQLDKTLAEAGVLVAFGQIIPQEIIDIFPCGIINIHPSMLPKYRGSTPIETTILDGAKETGVSLMALAAKMDAGPVYAQSELVLSGTETKAELADKLIEQGIRLLNRNLDSIIIEALDPTAQNDNSATYTKLINKSDGVVDFKQPAEQIERQVRAYAGWPKSRAKVLNQDIVITKARVTKDESDGDLVIKCWESWLEILELTGPSGRTMSGADFIRGYKK